MQTVKMNKKVQDCLTNWITYIDTNLKYSKNTVNAYISDIYYFLQFIYKQHNSPISLELLNQLQAYDFRSWFADRKKNSVTGTSNNRSLSSIKNFYKFLKAQYNIDNPSINHVKTAKPHKQLYTALLAKSIGEIMDAIDRISKVKWIGQRNKVIFYLLYACGLKLSEVLDLKLSDFKGEFSRVTILDDVNKKNMLHILPLIKKQLIDYVASCPHNIGNEHHVFLGEKGGKLTPDVFRKIIRNLKAELFLPNFLSQRSLKHSFSTHLLESLNNDSVNAQEFSGNQVQSTPQKHVRTDMDHLMKYYFDFHPRAKP